MYIVRRVLGGIGWACLQVGSRCWLLALSLNDSGNWKRAAAMQVKRGNLRMVVTAVRDA